MASWLGAHWKDVLSALLAVDVILIGFLPNVNILSKIKDFLSGIVGKSS